MDRACSTNGELMDPNRILVEKQKKMHLGRSRRRWVDNIKIDLREIGWDNMKCIDLAQDRDQWRALVNMVMNFRVPKKVGKFYSSCTVGGFRRRAQLSK
jgi:hypothetical protein